jgi:hypothetical protein
MPKWHTAQQAGTDIHHGTPHQVNARAAGRQLIPDIKAVITTPDTYQKGL